MTRRAKVSGAYSISCVGVDPASSPHPGAAVSKALTIANRVQRDLQPDEEVRTIYVREPGGNAIARVEVRHSLIQAFAI
jgi:hypothetical protein